MTPEQFAKGEYRNYVMYKALAAVETNSDFKEVLKTLTEHEHRDYQFWRQLARKQEYSVNPVTIYACQLMRKVFGLTFTTKFLELQEREMLMHYRDFLKTAPADIRGKVAEIVQHEIYHEKEMLRRIKEERVEFTGSIILGLNDGLIELTGALVGFAFAFSNTTVVALTGSITGIAAAMSMAASAYMQARHEEGKDPKKAAIYTGISYLAVVVVLVAPFVFINNLFIALGVMFAVIFAIILFISFYTSILFDRSFREQFGEMTLFSLGVALVAFLIGSGFRAMSGIEF